MREALQQFVSNYFTLERRSRLVKKCFNLSKETKVSDFRSIKIVYIIREFTNVFSRKITLSLRYLKNI